MISYTIAVYNEIKEISNLLSQLTKLISTEDELVIVHTYKNLKEMQEQPFVDIKNICNHIQANIKYNNFHFQNKFSVLKNYMNKLATQPYIINLDADEMVSKDTLEKWLETIRKESADLYYVPRINIVDDYTLQDIKQYQWNINGYGWINWPDYQPRIFKNLSTIQWTGDVHETLIGTNKALALPSDPSFAIIHHKTIEKQRQQNTLYTTIHNNLNQ